MSGKNSSKWIYGIIGLAGGMIICAILMALIMPSMMIVTRESKLGFDDTVSKIQERIGEQGWSVKGISDVKQEINKAGYGFEPNVKIIKLCKAEYAKEVLMTDRFISCMMPCSISVWEGDDGRVYLSEMNMGLMARLFGGNIGKVMGGKVVQDEEKMLEGLLM
ncbi:MAG: DUF302 domain-containing protein [Deltaproteobacteria bacterium]|nr:DUF302 domain-containing protein [Deltaproteobacteria bacterium]